MEHSDFILKQASCEILHVYAFLPLSFPLQIWGLRPSLVRTSVCSCSTPSLNLRAVNSDKRDDLNRLLLKAIKKLLALRIQTASSWQLKTGKLLQECCWAVGSKEQKHNEKHTFHHIYPATLPPMLPLAIRTYSSLNLDPLLVVDLCLAPRDLSDYTNLSRNPPFSLQATTSWQPSVEEQSRLPSDGNQEVNGIVWGSFFVYV